MYMTKNLRGANKLKKNFIVYINYLNENIINKI